MEIENLKSFLDEKVEQYNRPFFTESDPIQIPHHFTQKQDVEIAALLAATIAWGNRKAILKSGHKMLEILDNAPYDFVLNHSKNDLKKVDGFVHRTFNSQDFIFFIQQLKRLYSQNTSLEPYFFIKPNEINTAMAIERFRTEFLNNQLTRTQKHISSPAKNSSAKRLNMFLRWMVRDDNQGVDFGIWKKISPSKLSCPLDVHSGNVARKLGLLTRKQNDQKAVVELDSNLRKMDIQDPVKYDFALFGLGVFENF